MKEHRIDMTPENNKGQAHGLWVKYSEYGVNCWKGWVAYKAFYKNGILYGYCEDFNVVHKKLAIEFYIV